MRMAIAIASAVRGMSLSEDSMPLNIFLYPGLGIVIDDTERAHGKVGGWVHFERNAWVEKVNKKTVSVKLDYGDHVGEKVWKFPFSRVIRKR